MLVRLAPFLFVYRPEILLIGSPVEILWNCLVSAVGVIALAGSAIGYLGDRCRWYEWTLLTGGALLLLKPGVASDLAGMAVVGLIYVVQTRRRAGAASVPLAATG